jgi:hypothetical protein
MMMARSRLYFGVARRSHLKWAVNGQAVVEMAMLVVLLLFMLLGTFEIGRFAYYAIEVANAARAGVQYGSQSLADSNDGPGITQAAQHDALEIPNLDVKAVNHCACSDSPSDWSGGCPAQGCAPGHAIVFLDVKTSVVIQPVFRFPGLPSSFSGHGQAIMRVAQ